MNNLEILNEIHKGAKMGMDSISMITEKVDDANFKNDLIYQYKEYSNIADKATDELKNFNKIPDNENIGQKFMGWTGIQLNTLTDKSNSQISNMLIQGTTMGIIKGIQLLHSNQQIDENVKNLLDQFVTLQENNIEKLKYFL